MESFNQEGFSEAVEPKKELGVDLSDHGARSQPWVARMPSRPFVIVPPIGYPTPETGRSEQVLSLRLKEEFLSTITHGNHTMKACEVPVSWTYEQRREMQPILSFLYLGPWGSVKDRQELARHGITQLLGIRNVTVFKSKIMNASEIAKDLEITHKTIDISSDDEVISHFSEAIDAINGDLREVYRQQRQNIVCNENGSLMTIGQYAVGKTLVFCESGNDRSAAFVMAYLMAMYGLSFYDAVRFTQAQRFCAGLNETLKNALLSYELVLQAQRDVALTNSQSATKSSNIQVSGDMDELVQIAQLSSPAKTDHRRKKRMINDLEEYETQDGQERSADLERFKGRPQLAPYIDT